MFRKSLVAVFLSVLFAVMAGTTAFAAEETTMSPATAQALADVKQVNDNIYGEIAKAQVKADKMYAEYVADAATEKDAQKKAKLTAKYEEKISSLIEKLDAKTQKMTQKGKDKATAAGLTVEIVWLPFQFGDRTALIDPLVVIDW